MATQKSTAAPAAVTPQAAPIDFGTGDARYMADPASSNEALLEDLNSLLEASYDSLTRQPDEVDDEDWAALNLLRFSVGIARELQRRQGGAA